MTITTANIPMRTIGPIKMVGPQVEGDVYVPMATFETPLWPSTSRGAKVSYLAGGISTVVIDDSMSRSVVVDAQSAVNANALVQELKLRKDEIASLFSSISRYAKFKDIHTQVVGSLVYVRLSIQSGDASGHNMVTSCAETMLNWMLTTYPSLEYVSISSNFCTDKKASAVNGILGRGKYVVAEISITREICNRVLNTTPEKVVDLNIKKNLIGTMLAGGIRSANAHFANMLLAIYLATGQDAANIIEGSQGIVHAEVRNDSLYFSVTLPNIIVGTCGNGKDLDFTKANLDKMGCSEYALPGENAKRLACIIAAAVLCGELSLMAAQTNPGELMRTHKLLERSQKSALVE